jgi:hypothetical protein
MNNKVFKGATWPGGTRGRHLIRVRNPLLVRRVAAPLIKCREASEAAQTGWSLTEP